MPQLLFKSAAQTSNNDPMDQEARREDRQSALSRVPRSTVGSLLRLYSQSAQSSNYDTDGRGLSTEDHQQSSPRRISRQPVCSTSQLGFHTPIHNDHNIASRDGESRRRELSQLDMEDTKINQPSLNNVDPHLDRLMNTLLEQHSELRQYIAETRKQNANAEQNSTMRPAGTLHPNGIEGSSRELSKGLEERDALIKDLWARVQELERRDASTERRRAGVERRRAGVGRRRAEDAEAERDTQKTMASVERRRADDLASKLAILQRAFEAVGAESSSITDFNNTENQTIGVIYDDEHTDNIAFGSGPQDHTMSDDQQSQPLPTRASDDDLVIAEHDYGPPDEYPQHNADLNIYRGKDTSREQSSGSMTRRSVARGPTNTHDHPTEQHGRRAQGRFASYPIELIKPRGGRPRKYPRKEPVAREVPPKERNRNKWKDLLGTEKRRSGRGPSTHVPMGINSGEH